MLMLDTHVMIWFFMGDPKLGIQARERIVQMAQHERILISAISFAEVSMLQRKRRIDLGMPTTPWTRAVLDEPGVAVAPVDALIATDAGAFPDDIHGDPVDRIIMASARHHRVPLLTADHKMLGYGERSFVDVIDARI